MIENKKMVSKNKQRGATMIEYALIVSVIALLVLSSVSGVKDALKLKFEAITTALS